MTNDELIARIETIASHLVKLAEKLRSRPGLVDEWLVRHINDKRLSLLAQIVDFMYLSVSVNEAALSTGVKRNDILEDDVQIARLHDDKR